MHLNICFRCFCQEDMAMNITGRRTEQSILDDCLNSGKPEFLVLYGRRRVGKTYLIREFFNNEFSFYATGVDNVNTGKQLGYFYDSLKEYGLSGQSKPRDWQEAFLYLRQLLSDKNVKREPLTGRRIIFLDELPWMDTARSDFRSSLEHFWNSWASGQKDILLIVCGSATSWIMKNVLGNHGGLYNRITRQMLLNPFTLKECEDFFSTNGVILSREDVIMSYLIFGGIPYYMNLFNRRLSLAGNVDVLLFQENGQLYHEYDHLFHSLYRNPGKHLSIIRAMSANRSGMTRKEIIEKTKIADGALLTQAIEELEQCGFIRRYKNITKNKKECFFQIIDPFVLFSLNIMTGREFDSWIKHIGTPAYYSWRGNAFEIVCLNHLKQIKNALGITGVESNEYAWRSKEKKNGAQIDLIIDRADNVINICEMKFSSEPFEIDSACEKDLIHKLETFTKETGSKKAKHLTMISASGLVRNPHSGIIVNTITGDDLFV